MVSLVALVVWQINFLLVLAGFLVFGTLDGLYLSSAVTKVPDGAWFTLCLAVVLSSVFVLWRYGKENQWRAEASDRIEPRHLLLSDTSKPDLNKKDQESLGLRLRHSNAPLTKLRGVGVFFDKTGSPDGTPTVFIHFLQKFQACPSVVVFFHIRPLSIPTVPPEERFSVSHCTSTSGDVYETFPNFFRVTIRHGYTDRVLTNDLSLFIHENIRDFVIREGAGLTNPTSEQKNIEGKMPEKQESESEDEKILRQELVRHRLNHLQDAYEEQVVHIVGKEQMRIDEVKHCGGWFRKIALAGFLWLRSNTGSKVANMNLDVQKLVEVGFVKTI